MTAFILTVITGDFPGAASFGADEDSAIVTWALALHSLLAR